jgi:diguanylate cyclase (GGDEF)-like protein
VVEALEKSLPELFPKAAGILYMYGGVQTELHKILSFGDYVISDDTIMPAECASFNVGDIVVTNFTTGEFTGGCTHLHHHPQGVSFCAPIEGLEEHFGILCIQVDKFPEGESLEFWKAKVSIVAATFGLYVANQNLNLRFQQHSIRDSLTGLFNRRYMEESLRREVSAARRHNTPIGIIMMYPDAIETVNKEKGHHAVEQLLWELGQRLPGFIRTEDIPCRFDGNILCVILPGADSKITLERAERIRREISQLQIAYGDGILATNLSMGVSVMPDHAQDEGGLIYSAQMALQLSINNGGNRVVSVDALR